MRKHNFLPSETQREKKEFSIPVLAGSHQDVLQGNALLPSIIAEGAWHPQ